VVRDDLVSSVDLVPTLLDYAGARVPGTLPGRSLRPRIEGHGEWTRREVIGGRPMPHGSLTPDEEAPGLGRYRFFLRTPRWHYIWLDGDGSELYDMEADPEQQRNLAERHPELVARFRARIQEWQAEVERPFRGGSAPEAPVSPPVSTQDARG
jgi:arylsulfatase A-like enzyme